MSAYLFGCSILLSACLLMQVQPMLGKAVSPWFGASPNVWTTALLVYQGLLLVGYVYAHLVAKRGIRTQCRIHGVLLIAAGLCLPLAPAEGWRPQAGDEPVLTLVMLLVVTVGLPFVALAATTPLVHRWLSTHKASSYRLYAISNAGSLLGLLTYPFVIEPMLSLSVQRWLWSAGFAVFGVLVLCCAWRRLRCQVDQQNALPTNGGGAAPQPRSVSLGLAMVWLLLAGCGSLLLAATTNRISQDIPPVPFLFVLPLSLYLLTFILAFHRAQWYYRSVFGVLLPLVMIVVCLSINESHAGMFSQILRYSAVLIVGCMCCHGELARMRPPATECTWFYLVVALGGVLGSSAVVFGAPAVFDDYWEYEVGVAGCYVLVMLLMSRDLYHWARRPIPATDRNRKGAPVKDRRQMAWAGLGSIVGVSVALAIFTIVYHAGLFLHRETGLIARSRDFFGVQEVREFAVDTKYHKYALYHGRIRHGTQYRRSEWRGVPTTYYGRESGVGLAVRRHPLRRTPGRQFRVGVIGLGSGVLSAYGNDPETHSSRSADDYMAYYEINPQMVSLAETHFTFLADARDRGADVEIFLGDARQVLERQLTDGQSQEFDVLVVDAFSGDAIPMHLLTTECFDVYRRHLRHGGILAVHVSNRHLNLYPVVRTLADAHGWQSRFVWKDADDRGNIANRWVLVTANQEFLADPNVKGSVTPTPPQWDRRVVWTDEHSSLLSVVLD